MARFDILGLQYFTDGGELLGGGKLNFYETGTTTRKDTFSDSAMTIANTNPVTLDADGRAPDIFFSGLAKCVLTDSTGVVLETKDPVGSAVSGSGFPAWAADESYEFNQPVTGSNGYIYTSLENNNIGNDPLSNPADWQLIAKTIGIPDSPNGNVLIIDTAQPLKMGSVLPSTLTSYVPILSTLVSNAATVDFTGITSAYDEYEIRLQNVRPQIDGATLEMRTSSNNGGVYDSGGSDYRWIVSGGPNNAANTVRIENNGAGNANTTEFGVNTIIRIINPSNTTLNKAFTWVVSVVDLNNNLQTSVCAGARNSNSAVNAVRFFFSSGNVLSGRITLYGVKTS